ncbi:MAG: hypothetical protein ACREJC_02770 [Tepidisphaeraceae bacterium]
MNQESAPKNGRKTIQILRALGALGILARVALAWISWGSNDADIWNGFAERIAQGGLLHLYAAEPEMNHPPIAGLWSLAALKAAQMSRLSFSFIFKLPMIAADAVVCAILFRIWRGRRGGLWGAAAACLFAWNLDSILISGHHCNTDSVYSMFCLLSVYLVEARGAHFLAGLALGGAINVKLLPVLLVIPMLGAYRNRSELLRFLGGLAVAAVPFAPVLWMAGGSFLKHAVLYKSMIGRWGVNDFLLEASRHPPFSAVAMALMNAYRERGSWVVFGAIVLMTLYLRRSGSLDRYSLVACAATLFMVLTPGFGLQYTVFPGTLMFAAALFPGALYGLLAGLFALFCYWETWHGDVPMNTSAVYGPRAVGPLFGLLAWATLVVYVWRTLRAPAVFAGAGDRR